MMNLLADMDLKNIKIENLAKAKNDFEFCWPPSEDGGNSDGGNSDEGNSNGDNSNGDNSKAGELLNRNAALAHSIRKK